VIFKNKNFLSNLKFKASFKLRKSLQQLCSITEDRNRQNIQYTMLNAHEYSDGDMHIQTVATLQTGMNRWLRKLHFRQSTMEATEQQLAWQTVCHHLKHNPLIIQGSNGGRGL